MPASPVRIERDGDVAELVLANPPLNLFDAAVFAALPEALSELEATPPRALLLRAEGDIVSGGVEVSEFAVYTGGDETREFIESLLAITHRIEDLPCPTLFLAHGLTLTAALEIALACDFIWAGEGVQFGLVEAIVGITPLMGGTQRMVQRAGVSRAKELVMTRGLYTADTLYGWGVVNRVVPGGELLDEGRSFAARLAAGPTVAHVATKRVAQASADHGVRGADDRTAGLTAHLFATDDHRNALHSFRTEGPGKATFTGH